MGANKGQGGTSYQSSQVQIPPEVMARYNAVNARAESVANTPWQAYTGEFVAPVNQTQQGGIDAISGAAGTDKPYFDQATSVLNQSINPTNQLFGTAAGQVGSGLAAGNQYTQQGIDTAGAAAGAASPYNGLAAGQLNTAYAGTQPINNAALGLAAGATGAVNPGQLDVARYMSPYNEGVVQSTLGLLSQQQKMDRNDLRDQMIMQGSFGGDRSGVANANLQRQQDLAYGNVASQLYNANYSQALGAAQQQQGVGLSADQANRAALASGAQNIAGISQQMYGQGAATAQGNLGIGQQVYGQGQGLASAQMQGGNQLFQQGAGAASTNAGLASGMYGVASGTANTLGQLGTQQLGNQLTQGQAQIGAGTVQQQTQQAQDTALYNQFLQEKGYPFQVAQFLANIALGTGAQSGSTTNTVNTQAQPFFSDERLKENIHVIGHTNDGQPIIRFNYKGDKSTQIGLSAQETEKKHPEAVGLASGFKTVDYDAATRDSIAKAGGGGLAAGNDNFAQLLAQQRAMFPGGDTNMRGIPTGEGGVGPHGIPIVPLRAQAPKAANHSMPQQSQQPSGLKQTTDSIKGLYDTGKALASGYGEAKDALVGTAGKDGKGGTGGLIGTGGKYDWQSGWLGKQLSNDNPATTTPGQIQTTELAAPTTADSGLGIGASSSTIVDPWGYAFGGRARRAAGGGMPYGAEGYVPEELYKPIDPEKPDAAKPAGGPGGSVSGGKKDETGKAVGSLVGMGLGSMVGMPGLGSMIGGMAGGLFNEGGRVGLAAGGGVMDEDEASRIALESGNVLPFERPGHRAEPALPKIPAPIDQPLPPQRWPSNGVSPRSPTEIRHALRQLPVGQDTPPPTVANMGPPPEGLAAGQNTPAGGPSAPTLPDGTPIVDTPPAASAAPAGGLATLPATGAPSPAAVQTARTMLTDTRTAAASGPGRRSETPYDPKNPAGYTQFVFGGESNGRDFNNPRFPIAQGGPDGPGQFIGQTWQGFVRARPDLFTGKSPGEIDAMRRDPELAAMATDWYANVNAGPLQQAGVPLTYGNLYMAHMLDGRPAASLLANPDMNAVQALVRAGVPEAQARRSIIDNGGDVNMTAAQFAQLHKDRLDGVRSAPRQQVTALNAGPGTGDQNGLAAGQGLGPAPDAQPVPDFLDRAGNWIDRNQRPIMAGLAFIGNMLGSKSHQLTGAIGDGLAAAAPFYLNTGYKEQELGQSQQRINITERSQYLSVLAQLQAMQAANVQAGKGRNPEIDRQITQITQLIQKAGGVSPAVAPGGTGGTGQPGGTTPVRAGRTDLTPQGIPAGPAPGPVTSSPLPPPGSAPAPAAEPTPAPGTQPVPASNRSDPYAMPAMDPGNAAFRARIKPEMNPDVWLQKSRELADVSPEESRRALERAQELEKRMRDTGETVDVNGNVLWVPGFREMQAAKQRMQTNPQFAEEQRVIATQRQRMRQQVDALKELTNAYESGALNSVWADVDGKLKAVGLPGLGGGSAENYQKFMKEASAVMLASAQSMPAGHGPTDALRQQIATSFAAPTLQPEANRKILANTTALLDWADKNYTDTMKELEDKPWLDTRRYFDDWSKQNNLQDFTKRADKETTTAGMNVPKSLAELEEGRLYNMKPEDVFRLMRDNPTMRDKITIDEIKKNFGGKPNMRLRAVKTPDGKLRLVPE